MIPGKVAMFRKIFNVGPFEVSGSNEVLTIKCLIIQMKQKYVVKGARPLEE
jgi:penicillin amidase